MVDVTFSVACGAMLSFWEAEPSPEQPAHQHVVEKGWVLELQWEQVTDLVDGPAADTTRPNLVPEVAHLKKMPAKHACRNACKNISDAHACHVHG